MSCKMLHSSASHETPVSRFLVIRPAHRRQRADKPVLLLILSLALQQLVETIGGHSPCNSSLYLTQINWNLMEITKIIMYFRASLSHHKVQQNNILEKNRAKKKQLDCGFIWRWMTMDVWRSWLEHHLTTTKLSHFTSAFFFLVEYRLCPLRSRPALFVSTNQLAFKFHQDVLLGD